jgi:sec-independent protein translocase protein TatC
MAGIFGRGGNSSKAEMSFIDHLEELRSHIVRSVIAILLVAIVIFIFHTWIYDNIISGPLNQDFITYRALCSLSHKLHLGNSLCLPPVAIHMQSNTFGGQFLSAITLSFVGGIIVAFPYIFWEFWRFVKPALREKELKNTRSVIFWVSFFFFSGALFGFFLLGPFTFNFLASFQLGSKNQIATVPTLTDYFDNLTNLILGCGIAFELPVLAYVLTKIGLVTPMFLRKSTKYAVVVILIISAFITPSPDWYSQLIVFIPLMTLYWLGIVVSKRAYRKIEKEDKIEEWS